MEEEIIGVVSAVRVGGAPGSLYLLIPLKIRERYNVKEGQEFIVKVNGNCIIYESKRPLKKLEREAISVVQ